MKKLKVDVEDIVMIMDNQERFENHYYLDTEKGETLCIPDELMNAFGEGESCEGLPAWELELLPQAKEIIAGSDRYEEIPIRYGHQAFDLMVEFAKGVTDQGLQKALYSALNGRGAFRRFKDVLREYPEVEKQWFKFKAEKDREEVKGWLKSIGIEMVED
jgi:hypothetical protein